MGVGGVRQDSSSGALAVAAWCALPDRRLRCRLHPQRRPRRREAVARVEVIGSRPYGSAVRPTRSAQEQLDLGYGVDVARRRIGVAMECLLFLFRHGETDWNRAGRLQGHTDTPLNSTGLAQAEALTERLRQYRLEAVMS